MTKGTSGALSSRRHLQWLSTIGATIRTPRGAVGLALTSLIVLVAIIGPFVAPYSPTAFVTVPLAGPTRQFIFGADVLGRDVLSWVLNGGWVLLIMAVLATAIGVVLGAAAGMSAAYLRGKWDAIIMRSVDVILAFPSLVLALMLVSIIGSKLWLIVLAVGFTHALGRGPCDPLGQS